MNSNSRATAVGVFVLIGLLCLAYMTIKLGKMEFFSNEGFELQAVFTNVSGLRVGADIEMAGIPVGHLSKISLRRTDTDRISNFLMTPSPRSKRPASSATSSSPSPRADPPTS